MKRSCEVCGDPAKEWPLGKSVLYLCGECAARIGFKEGNPHPERDGQVRPDPITPNGGATASGKSVATPGAEAVTTESIGTSAEVSDP